MSDWSKNFEVVFQDEEGELTGGLDGSLVRAVKSHLPKKRTSHRFLWCVVND